MRGHPNRRASVGRREPAADAPGHGPHADPDAVARTICLAQLDRAPRTRAQLAETLQRRLVPDDAAERVLDRLEEVGLIDDRAYAEAWVRSRHSSRKLAGRTLARELRDRGVAGGDIEAALGEITPDGEFAAARALVRSRLPSLVRADPATRWRRLVGLLARKGYSPEVVYAVLRAELRGPEQEDDIDPADLPGVP